MTILVDEEDFIDKSSNSCAHKWADPVHPVAVPRPTDDGRAEGHRRVHGCPVKRPTSQDVGPDDEADGDGGNDPYVAFLGIYCRGVNCVH